MPTASTADIADRTILLFDDYYTESRRVFVPTQHLPVRDTEPVVQPDRPWEMGGLSGSSNLTVFEDDGLYRMWYTAVDPNYYPQKGQRAYTEEEIADLDEKTRADIRVKNRRGLLCYAESHDGVEWQKPALGLFEYEGRTDNNILAAGLGGTVFVDPTAPPAERYKLIHGHGPRLPQVYRTGPQAEVERLIFRAVYGSTSPDGLSWTTAREPIMEWYADTTNVAYWDPRRQKYVAFVRINQNLGFENRQTVIQERGAEHYRCVGRSESDDFFNFPPPVKVAEPPADIRWPRETGIDYYNAAAVQHPDNPEAYFLFGGNFHHEQDVLEVALSTSRDGVNYDRWPEPVVGPGMGGAWDGRSIYMGTGMLFRGDETYMYYHGRNWPHAERAASSACGGVGRVRFRRDGFVSQRAPGEGGELVTRPLVFEGSRLAVNFDAGAGGRLRVELQSESGRPLPGFTAEEADEQLYNDTARVITWQGKSDLSSLAGKPLRIRFLASAADLYAFRFRED